MSANERTRPFLTDEDWEVLNRVCEEMKVPPDIVERMLWEENKVYAMGRRHRIKEVIGTLITEGLSSEGQGGVS
jgi:hypothetical protein